MDEFDSSENHQEYEKRDARRAGLTMQNRRPRVGFVLDVSRAIQILRDGGLVAFPTETVYGLGADATNSAAVGRIFAAKGRPATNPLIVHVADAAVARRYARTWSEMAAKLAARFWPGPLTLVVPKAKVIVPETTAGLDSVGLRCPDHPLALELLRQFDGPIAAPSANRSTRVSPTTAQHVREELGDAVDYILDGGPCTVGIESTVLDLAAGAPTILRPGAITAEMIEEALGERVGHASHAASADRPARSPGQHRVHYAPRAEAIRFERGQIGLLLDQPQPERWAIMFVGAAPAGMHLDGRVVEMPDSPAEYARVLYLVLRQLDAAGMQRIWVESPPDLSQWRAVNDRLRRATKLSG